MNNSFQVNKNPLDSKSQRYSISSDLNEFNTDIINIMKEVISLLIDLSNIKNTNIFDMKYKDPEQTKKLLLQNLKKIRKELSKETIPVTKVRIILNNNIQDFIQKLIESLNDLNDNNIEIESLWIINNLILFIPKYNDITLNSVKNANLLNYYLIKLQKEKKKNML